MFYSWIGRHCFNKDFWLGLSANRVDCSDISSAKCFSCGSDVVSHITFCNYEYRQSIWQYRVNWQGRQWCGWHLSLPLMNSFNKIEAAIFPCRLCLLRAFPFLSLIERGLYKPSDQYGRRKRKNESLFCQQCNDI